MGHYAAEMMCDDCGNLRCTCPPKKEKPNKSWIVNHDFTIQRVQDFDADPANNVSNTKYGPIPQNPVLLRFGRQQFKNREDAEAHAREMCEQAVEATRDRLTRLKKILKVERPWERK